MKNQFKQQNLMTQWIVQTLMRNEREIILNNYVFNLSFPKRGLSNYNSKKEEIAPEISPTIPQTVQDELEKLREENAKLKHENEELKKQRDMNYHLYLNALKKNKPPNRSVY